MAVSPAASRHQSATRPAGRSYILLRPQVWQFPRPLLGPLQREKSAHCSPAFGRKAKRPPATHPKTVHSAFSSFALSFMRSAPGSSNLLELIKQSLVADL